MQNHRVSGSPDTVIHINTFDRALNVGAGLWVDAPQVVSWEQGSPFVGIAGRCEEDIAGGSRVWIIGPAGDTWGPYVRVLRVSIAHVTDAPLHMEEALRFGESLDTYAREGKPESSWFRANAELRRWTAVVADSIVTQPQLYRQHPRTQLWRQMRPTMPYALTGFRASGKATSVAS